MSLGKNISRLRAARELSQDDLVAALGVSRQSVSKWETDSSVPELDKLVKLSELFSVSLDELVLDRPAGPDLSPEPAPAAEPAAPARPLPRLQRLVGILLLFFGGIVILLLTVMGAFLGGLLFASPFLLCGVVCLVFRRHAGLWCGWAVFFCVDTYLRYATGLTWGWIILALRGLFSMSNPLQLPMAWAELLVMLLLVVLTAVLLRKKPFRFTRRNTALFIAGWAVFLFLPLLDQSMFLALYNMDWGRSLYFYFGSALGCLRLALLAGLVTCLVRGIWGKRTKEA